MKKIKFFALCAAIMSFSSCVLVNISNSGFDSVRGEGDLQSYEIRVGEYSKIRLEGFCDIRYYSAPSNTVKLEVQPNIHEYFVVEVVGDELVLRTTRGIAGSSKTPVLTVSSPELSSLSLSGANNFTAYDKITTNSFTFNLSGSGRGNAEFDVNNLYVSASGPGNLVFSGNAVTVDMRTSGSCTFDALSLQAREARVNLSGSGKIRINSSETLRIDASGSGTIEYKGSPTLVLNTSGSVSIKRVN
jgi:hypothetical protein